MGSAYTNSFLDNIGLSNKRSKNKKLQVGYKNVTLTEITGCVFADDLVTFARNIATWRYGIIHCKQEIYTLILIRLKCC